MKMSQKTRWILTLGILLILLIGVGVYYALQLQENGRLEDDLEQARVTFLANSTLKQQHLNDIEQANLEAFRYALAFPTSEESTEIEEALFGAAAEAQVVVSAVSCSEPRAQAVGSNNYQVYSVTTSVRGTPENVVRFLGVLGYWLPSANMDSIGLSMPGQGETTLNLALSVYTLPA